MKTIKYALLVGYLMAVSACSIFVPQNVSSISIHKGTQYGTFYSTIGCTITRDARGRETRVYRGEYRYGQTTRKARPDKNPLNVLYEMNEYAQADKINERFDTQNFPPPCLGSW